MRGGTPFATRLARITLAIMATFIRLCVADPCSVADGSRVAHADDASDEAMGILADMMAVWSLLGSSIVAISTGIAVHENGNGSVRRARGADAERRRRRAPAQDWMGNTIAGRCA